MQVLLGKNPTGLNQVLRAIASHPGRKRVLFFLNDGIADGRDISWIWDTDYELLQPQAEWVLASGTRAEDLALRLKYAGFGDDPPLERDAQAAIRRAISADTRGRDAVRRTDLHRDARSARDARAAGRPRPALLGGRMTAPVLRVAHLYPRLMNIYGDRGNIMCLRHRCEARGIGFELTELSTGDALDPRAYDLIFAGGAQDREQRGVADDLLATKAAAIREAVEADVSLLAVCGAYQLFGRLYRDSSGAELPGVGVFDLETHHPGPQARRCIGNIVADWRAPDGSTQTIVGFENHGGRTRLGPNARPLARVRHGFGNNGEDGTEGAMYRNAIGTYIHGSLLPKNPALADAIITTALQRRYEGIALAPIDDRAEQRAHTAALRLR